MYLPICLSNTYVCVYVCMSVCLSVLYCMYVCMYVCTYVYDVYCTMLLYIDSSILKSTFILNFIICHLFFHIQGNPGKTTSLSRDTCRFLICLEPDHEPFVSQYKYNKSKIFRIILGQRVSVENHQSTLIQSPLYLDLWNLAYILEHQINLWGQPQEPGGLWLCLCKKVASGFSSLC